jgi:hypothetical protein
MNALDWCGIGALAAIVLSFGSIRRIPAYIGATSAVVAAFAVAPYLGVDVVRSADWLVMTAGLAACAFGLLIVRVMLVRSVSLLLLARLGEGPSDLFRRDIRGRLDDMQRFGLIRSSDGRYTLTSFGMAVGGAVTASYKVFRIKT